MKKKKRKNEKSHRAWRCSSLGLGPRFRLRRTAVDRTSLRWSLWIAWLTFSAQAGLSWIWHSSAGNPLEISMQGPLGCVCGTDHLFIFCSVTEPRMFLLRSRALRLCLLSHCTAFRRRHSLCRLPNSGPSFWHGVQKHIAFLQQHCGGNLVPINVKLNSHHTDHIFSHSVHIPCGQATWPSMSTLSTLCQHLSNQSEDCCCCYQDNKTAEFDFIAILAPGVQRFRNLP